LISPFKRFISKGQQDFFPAAKAYESRIVFEARIVSPDVEPFPCLKIDGGVDRIDEAVPFFIRRFPDALYHFIS
jgi:hypothetical protein